MSEPTRTGGGSPKLSKRKKPALMGRPRIVKPTGRVSGNRRVVMKPDASSVHARSSRGRPVRCRGMTQAYPASRR
jgi:hypothetical protein